MVAPCSLKLCGVINARSLLSPSSYHAETYESVFLPLLLRLLGPFDAQVNPEPASVEPITVGIEHGTTESEVAGPAQTEALVLRQARFRFEVEGEPDGGSLAPRCGDTRHKPHGLREAGSRSHESFRDGESLETTELRRRPSASTVTLACGWD